MNKSKHLEKITEDCNKMRTFISKRTLIVVILLVVVTIIAYFGIIALDSRSADTAASFSTTLGLITLFFFIRFLSLNGNINDKVLMKCEQKIQQNLKSDETFETFDNDMKNPAFGIHQINGSKVLIGHTFVLFQSYNTKGPYLNILRGDNLGDFNVHYFSRGSASDIGMDINDKNGKFIRSVMTSNKDQFYELLNAMEKIKNYANGNDIPVGQDFLNQDDPFVKALKQKVNRVDKKSYNKIGFLGIMFGIFLVIAASSSGVGFAYAGLILIVISIFFIIGVQIKLRR